VSYIGYEATSLPEILVGSGKEVVLEIPISESLLTFEEVVVTSEGCKGMPQNVTNRLNEMNRFWSSGAGKIRSNTQFWILPNLSYRIEF